MEKQYHIKLSSEDIGKYVILPGDPGRCKEIAKYFDEPKFVTSNREYTTYTGTILGEKVSVTNTGIVGPSAASREYAPIEYPAVPDFQVATALVQACKELNKPYHCGVVQCKDSFYGQHNPNRMPVSYELLNKWEAWKRLGVLASEMESAALFTVADSLGVRCGSVFNVIWNQERKALGYEEPDCLDTDIAVRAAVLAIKLLIEESKNDR